MPNPGSIPTSPIPTPTNPVSPTSFGTTLDEMLGGISGGFNYGPLDRQIPAPHPAPYVPIPSYVPQQLGAPMGTGYAREAAMNSLMGNLTKGANLLGEREYQKKLSKAVSLWENVNQALETGDKNYLATLTPKEIKDMNEALGLHLQPLSKQTGKSFSPVSMGLKHFLNKAGNNAAQKQALMQRIQPLLNSIPRRPLAEQIQNVAQRRLITGNANSSDALVSNVFGSPAVIMQDATKVYNTDLSTSLGASKIATQLREFNASYPLAIKKTFAAITTAQAAIKRAQALEQDALARGDMAEAMRERADAMKLSAQVSQVGQSIHAFDAARTTALGKVNAAKEQLLAFMKAHKITSNIDTFIYSRESQQYPMSQALIQRYKQAISYYSVLSDRINDYLYKIGAAPNMNNPTGSTGMPSIPSTSGDTLGNNSSPGSPVFNSANLPTFNPNQ